MKSDIPFACAGEEFSRIYFKWYIIINQYRMTKGTFEILNIILLRNVILLFILIYGSILISTKAIHIPCTCKLSELARVATQLGFVSTRKYTEGN